MLLIEKGRLEFGDKDVIGTGARFFDDGLKDKRLVKYQKWAQKNKSK